MHGAQKKAHKIYILRAFDHLRVSSADRTANPKALHNLTNTYSFLHNGLKFSILHVVFHILKSELHMALLN